VSDVTRVCPMTLFTSGAMTFLCASDTSVMSDADLTSLDVYWSALNAGDNYV
jgi:hypothetical protein